MSLMKRSRSAGSLVQALAPRPKRLSFVEIARTCYRFAASQEFRPGLDGFLHVIVDVFHCVRSSQRAHVGFGVEGIAEFQGLHLADEFLFESISDFFVNDEAFRGDARLAIIDDSRLHAHGDGFLKIGAGHDDEGVATPEFEHHFLNAFCRGHADLDAGLLAASESGGGYARIVQNAIDLRGPDEQSLENTLRETRPEKNVFNLQGTLWNIGRMLEQAYIAGDQAGRDEAETLPEGKVPGHDRENDAERLIANETLGGSGGDDFVGDEFCAVFGVIAAAKGALFGFSDGRAEGFPHFEGHQAADRLFFSFENFAGSGHPAGTIGKRRMAVTLKSLGGFGDFFVDLRVRERIEFLDDFTCCGIDSGNGHETLHARTR
jgi:hypothetical protein